MKLSMKTAIPATMVALSAMTVAGCGSKINSETNKNKIELAPYDSTKQNLPIINDNKVTYRNMDGDIVTIQSMETKNSRYSKLMTSLYKAINKFSTKENPNITNPDGFYVEVEKNIPKSFKSESIPDEYDELYALKSLQASHMLSELVDMFTEDDSEDGKNISVNEYTQMMDAWSSLGIKE